MNSKELFNAIVCKLSCKFGAPMGRTNNLPRKNYTYPEFNDMEEVWENVPFFDRVVPLDSGGYDKGGAYWGLGTPLRVRYSKDGVNYQFYRK